MASVYGKSNTKERIKPLPAVPEAIASTSIARTSLVTTSSLVVSITAGVAAVAVPISVESIVILVDNISTESVTFLICTSTVPVIPAVPCTALTSTKFIPLSVEGTMNTVLPSPVVCVVAAGTASSTTVCLVDTEVFIVVKMSVRAATDLPPSLPPPAIKSLMLDAVSVLFCVAIINKPSYEFDCYLHNITKGERLNLFNICQK